MANILLIDDSEDIRELLLIVLEAEGHTCFAAEDGRKGLEYYHQHNVDLVITDIYMPEQDGLETIMAMRREQDGLPIIAMTGSGMHLVDFNPLQIAETFGAQKCLHKPFSNDELVKAVNELLAS